MEDIKGFDGEFRWLSNFWKCEVELDGMKFDSTENAYQAAKCENIAERIKFTNITAGQAKRLSRQINVREDWDSVKLEVMDDLLRQKFENKDLADKLLATGDCLIEETNSWADVFWGVCGGVGENNLGRLLMKIREDLWKGLVLR